VVNTLAKITILKSFIVQVHGWINLFACVREGEMKREREKERVREAKADDR
jgi:hypothetical protein